MLTNFFGTIICKAHLPKVDIENSTFAAFLENQKLEYSNLIAQNYNTFSNTSATVILIRITKIKMQMVHCPKRAFIMK